MKGLRSLRRASRKHASALVAWLVFVVVLFLPALMSLKILSPNELLHWTEPWRSVELMFPQNGLMSDPATSLYTLVALFKSDPGSVHWNPYIASGTDGIGSVATSLLSPFSMLSMLLPLEFFYTGLVLFKFSCSFLFGYLWLREESLGKQASAAGAIILSAAGAYVVWWLWQGTNATALYPAMLWVLARMSKGRRVPFWCLVALAWAFVVSGFPSTSAYAVYLGAAYTVVRCRRDRGRLVSILLRSATAGTIAVLLAWPFLRPFFDMVLDSGYLRDRQDASFTHFYPPSMVLNLTNAFRLTSTQGWLGDPALGINNNLVESTIYLGIGALFLAFVGLGRRASGARWFWVCVAAVTMGSMFGTVGVARIVGSLPGIEYTPLTRLRVILPIPVAYLAASGLASLRRQRGSRTFQSLTGLLVILWLSLDYGLIAKSYYPFVDASDARVGSTPTIDFLHSRKGPFRIVATDRFLVPNTSELAGVEDIRSHFRSSARYREIMKRISPGSWGKVSTYLLAEADMLNLDHPFLHLLNVRYLLEGPDDFGIERRMATSTLDATSRKGYRVLHDGDALPVCVDTAGVYAYRVEFRVPDGAPESRIELEILDPESGGDRVALSTRRPGVERRTGAVFIAVPSSSPVRLELVVHVKGSVEVPVNDDGTPVVGYVSVPWIPIKAFPDGAVFENLRFVERFRPVWNTQRLETEKWLATEDLDPALEVVLDPGEADLTTKVDEIAEPDRQATVRLVEYEGQLQRLETESAVPFILASSEKLTQALSVTVDGRTVEPLRADGMFAAVEVDAGKHEIVFARRLGRGLWAFPLAGLGLWVVFAFGSRARARRHAEDAA